MLFWDKTEGVRLNTSTCRSVVMPEEPPAYTPTTIETVFELLDKKLVSLGVPTAISAVGVNAVRTGDWKQASWCFAGAAGVWILIKVGKKLAPKFDQLLDWGISAIETSIDAVRANFTGSFLKQQAQLNEEFITEGYNPERTAIPLLEEVFVPLELSGVVTRNPRDAALNENLDIWELLRRSRSNRSFRQMTIQAKGGMGKTTLLRHIALIYGQRKQRRYRAPKLVPILLRLRDYQDELTQSQRPSLPKLITEHQIPRLWEGRDNPPTPPQQWAENLLTTGLALVMFDGFDEIREDKRSGVSRWISSQMQQYGQAVFILSSRPAGYKDYTAKKPAIPIFVKKFNPQQQEDFIRRWYLCQEKCCRPLNRRRQAKAVAQKRSKHLVDQLQARREELGYMAENPLLLNMLATFHRFDVSVVLPSQRLELYRGICKLQLEDRPKARLIRMLLSYRKSNMLLQRVALGMVKANRLTLSQAALLKFLAQQPLLTQEEVDPADWLKQIVEVSELLVEREPGEYEFPHASFQGFFAATLLAQPEDKPTIQKSVQLVLKNWTGAIWRETVLLYTAQLTPKLLNYVILEACKQGSEAADLAAACLKEYPRPEKLSDGPTVIMQRLSAVTQDSRYQALKRLLKAQQWRKADKETYRLMITAVGKEEGQLFEDSDLLQFPCEDLKAIDGHWVKYSNGKFGFSVQKRIYIECGATLDGKYPGDKIWDGFCDRVGWRKGGKYLNYTDLQFNLEYSPEGELPNLRDGTWWVICWAYG